MNDYYVPSRQELIDAMRAEMAFLVSTYGFHEVTERTEKYINPYSVLYRKEGVSVLVEGVSYGFGLNCEVVAESECGGDSHDRINLGYLIKLRAPQLLEPTYPDKRGQLKQLPKLAEALKRAAADLLAGDISHLAEIRDFIRREQETAARENRSKELSRIDVKSQEAFHQRDYHQVLDLLVPIESELTEANRKRLELARKNLKQGTGPANQGLVGTARKLAAPQP